MLKKGLQVLYNKLRLVHYKSLFGSIREREGSLSATEAFAVDMIHLLGRPTLKQFAQCLGISQPNATHKVNNLIAKGYLSKTGSEDDRRACRLSVTDKFISYYKGQADVIGKAVERVQKRFTREELDTFERVLSALEGAME